MNIRAVKRILSVVLMSAGAAQAASSHSVGVGLQTGITMLSGTAINTLEQNISGVVDSTQGVTGLAVGVKGEGYLLSAGPGEVGASARFNMAFTGNRNMANVQALTGASSLFWTAGVEGLYRLTDYVPNLGAGLYLGLARDAVTTSEANGRVSQMSFTTGASLFYDYFLMDQFSVGAETDFFLVMAPTMRFNFTASLCAKFWAF